MKPVLLFALIFFPLTMFAQEEDDVKVLYGEIIYESHRDEQAVADALERLSVKNPKAYAIMRPEITRWNELASNFEFLLYFSNDESLSYMAPEASNGDQRLQRELEAARSLVRGDYRYYLNTADTGRLYEATIPGTANVEHLTEPFDKYNWKITSESKQIGKYTCRKATGSYSKEMHDEGLVTIPVTAWFAPQLPFPYGPMGFDGLPGLILEVTEEGRIPLTFQATGIEVVRDSDERIPKLNDPIRVMTIAEANEMARGRMQRIRR